MNAAPETTTLGPGRRRNGKVARLPKAQRDLINQLLDDGLAYTDIINKLAEDDVSLSEVNLSRWQHGGYQDWLKEQIWREEIHSRHEAYSDLLTEGQSATRLPEAALQLATTEICRRLHEITLTAHALDGTSDPNSFTRLVHALCRLSREVLHLQKYNDAVKATKEGGGKRFDAFRELTEAERQAILDKADDILGCRAYRGLPPLDPVAQVSKPAVSPASQPAALPHDMPALSSASVENQPNSLPLTPSSAGVSPAVSPTSSRPPVPQSVPATPAGQADTPIPSVPSVSSATPPESPADTPPPPAAKPPRRHPTPSMYGPPVQPPGPPKVPSIFDPPVRPAPGAPSAKPHPAFYPGLTPARKRYG